MTHATLAQPAINSHAREWWTHVLPRAVFCSSTTQPQLVFDCGSTKVACMIVRPCGGGGNGRPFDSAWGGRPEPKSRDSHTVPSADGTPEIMAMGLARYPAGTAWPVDPPRLAQAMAEALDDAKPSEMVDRATILVSHPHLRHRQVTVAVDLADEPIAVRWRDLHRLRQQLVSQAVPLDHDVLHLESLGYAGNGFERTRNPRGLPTMRLAGTFHLVTMPLALRRALLEAVELVGLDAERIVYSLLETVRACAGAAWASQRVLIVDVGGYETDIGLFDRGVLVQSITVPWGGMTVASALTTGCHLSMTQAMAASLEGLRSCRANVRAILEEQLAALQQALASFMQRETPYDQVIVTGGGALMDGLVEWVGQQVGGSAIFGRAPQLHAIQDLARQVALTSCAGWFSAAPKPATSSGMTPTRFVDRLLARIQYLLNEYF